MSSTVTGVAAIVPSLHKKPYKTVSNAEGTESRTTTLADGTVTQKTVLTYDENGNLSTSVSYDGEGNVKSKETHTWRAITVPIDCPRAPI